MWCFLLKLFFCVLEKWKMQITYLNDCVKLYKKNKIVEHVLNEVSIYFWIWISTLCFFMAPFSFRSLEMSWKLLCAPFASCFRAISFAIAIWKLPFHSIIKRRWFASGNSSAIGLLPWPTGSNLPFNRVLFHACGIMRRHNSLQMFFLFLFNIRSEILIWIHRIFYIILCGRIWHDHQTLRFIHNIG